MKNHRNIPTATSLPPAPEAQAASRLKRYALTMGIRTTCFILMAVVTPYGWYTWVFAAGAIFLPYVAVVYANAGEATTNVSRAEQPTLMIEQPSVEPDPAPAPRPTLTVHESDTAERPSADPAA